MMEYGMDGSVGLGRRRLLLLLSGPGRPGPAQKKRDSSYPTVSEPQPPLDSSSPPAAAATATAMLPLRARPPAAVPLSSSTTSAYYSFPLPSSSSSCCTAARCSVGSSAKLSAVQFEPLRSDSDPWGADQGVATTEDGEQQFNKDGPERDRKGIPGIHVPRQRYIAVPKAALLDAVLSQFPSEADAADSKRCARCSEMLIMDV